MNRTEQNIIGTEQNRNRIVQNRKGIEHTTS